MQLEDLKMSVKLDTRKLERSMKRLEKLAIKLQSGLEKFHEAYKLVEEHRIIEIELKENKLAKEQRLKLYENEVVMTKEELENKFKDFVSKKALSCCETIEQVKEFIEKG